jgi:uncharacterized protein (DUF1778 family)
LTHGRRAPDSARWQKTERLELRAAPSVRKVIEQASAVSGLAAGDLAYEGARRVLEAHKRTHLVGADRLLFLLTQTAAALAAAGTRR